jgi:streptogramin lyase
VEALEGRQLLATSQVLATLATGTGPVGITQGPDGNLWFAEFDSGGIGRVTPGGSVTEFTSLSPGARPVGITAGPDGALWFAEFFGDRIGRITTNGVVTEFSTGITPGAAPADITLGPDGNLWFTEFDGDKIGRITPQGVVTEFGGLPPLASPAKITAGPDGNLWFTELNGNQIGRITPNGTITEFATGLSPLAGPLGITKGPDGALWFTELYGNRVGRITTAGAITEVASVATGSGPAGIATGADGNLYFTEFFGARLGEVTPAGVVAEFAAPPGSTQPAVIVPTRAGTLAFTDLGTSRIDQVILPRKVPLVASGTTVAATAGRPVTGTFATFTGPSADPRAYQATINFGDGTVAPGAVVATGGRFAVVATHTYTRAGTFAAAVLIRDTAGDSAAARTSAVVATAPDLPLTAAGLTVRATQGQQFTGTVATFTDADPSGVVSDYTTTIAWGDGTTSPGTIVRLVGTSTPFAVLGSHVYAASGSRAIVVTILDKGGASATAHSTALVAPAADAPLSASAVPIGPLVRGVAFAGNVATFTDADPAGTASQFSATIDWGDGTTSPGGVTPDGRFGVNQFDVVGFHTYARAGRFSVTVSIRDVGGSTAGTTESVTVAAPPKAGGDGPRVVSVLRFGFHAMPTTLVLGFSQALDPARAQDARNYRIVGPGGRPIAVDSAVYDATTHTVTLAPHERLNVHFGYTLTVVGTGPLGVADASGRLLDGADTGRPGSDFTTVVDAHNLVLPGPAPFDEQSLFLSSIASAGGVLSNG